MKMKKLIAVLALGATVTTMAVPQPVTVQAGTINDTAKQNSYNGVTFAEQILAQEGIKYNDFTSAHLINYRNCKP